MALNLGICPVEGCTNITFDGDQCVTCLSGGITKKRRHSGQFQPITEGESLTKHVMTNLTSTDAEAALRRARANGMTLSGWVRELIKRELRR